MYAHTHTHTRTRPCAYACARTLAARESSQNIVGWGGIPAFEAAGIPVVEVHEGAKRPGMRIIPDSPENTPHQSSERVGGVRKFSPVLEGNRLI